MTTVGPRLAIVTGRRRTRAELSRPLRESSWEVAETSDLDHALYYVRRLEPDLVAFELALARAGHGAGVPSIQILAPRALYVTFGEPRPGTCRGELDELGVWCHLELPPKLPVDRLLEEYLGRFERALAGARTIVPQPDTPEPRITVTDEPAGARTSRSPVTCVDQPALAVPQPCVRTSPRPTRVRDPTRRTEPS